jgi:serine/threonine protein kinase
VTSNKLPAQYKIDGVQFNPRDRIATGGEAIIYRGTHDGKPVAVREIFDSEVSREEILSQVRREVIAQWQVDHPNLLRIKGVFMDGDTPLIVLPYLRGGNPMQVLTKTGDSRKLLFMFQGVISGLKHLHLHQQPPIIHGDIHPDNIMLDERGNIVLGDFGLSRIRHAQNRTHTIDRSGGKRRYLAPELYADLPQGRTTEASDVYSLAMTFLALATLEQPFSDVKGHAVASAAGCGNRPAKPSKTPLLTSGQIDRLWPLLEKMWSHLPADRPSIAQVECELNTCVAPLFQRGPLAFTLSNCSS